MTFLVTCFLSVLGFLFFFKQKTAYEMRISDWSSDVCSSDLLVDDGIAAQEQYGKLTDPVEAHDWLHGSLARSEAAINSKLGSGLAFLATVGATSPFIGLFGTVIGIYRALIKIGAAGQASIDAVARPAGEALIMTALGLAVAVPEIGRAHV